MSIELTEPVELTEQQRMDLIRDKIQELKMRSIRNTPIISLKEKKVAVKKMTAEEKEEMKRWKELKQQGVL